MKIQIVWTLLAAHLAYASESPSSTPTSSTCRDELNEYSQCLKTALSKTKMNRTALDISVKKCFEDNQCTAPNLDAPGENSATDSQQATASRRLQHSPFRNVDWTTFDQCKITVNTKARDRIRTCVINQVPSFAPDTDEDINDDGEQDGLIERNQTLGSYAISKLADSPSICGDSTNRSRLKQCIAQAFNGHRPAKDKKKTFDEYCSDRDDCKAKLSPQCLHQLNQSHRLLCQCSIDEIASPKGDNLRDEFLNCTKVDSDRLSSIASSVDANPHRTYASTSFCHARFDPCSWLWRQLADESSAPDTIQSIIDRLNNNAEVDRLNQAAQNVMNRGVESMSFYNNETNGQIGEILSSAFDQAEIDRLRQSLATFSNPYNTSEDDRSRMTNEQLVSDLVSRLNGNKSEVEKLADIGAEFFGFDRNSTNDSMVIEDIETLAERLTDPEQVKLVETALFHFLYPNGNMTDSNSTGASVEAIVNGIKEEGAGQEEKLIDIVNRFQNPYQTVSVVEKKATITEEDLLGLNTSEMTTIVSE